MDREPSRDHHVQHRALLVQQVRLCYRCRPVHARSYPRRHHRGAAVSESWGAKFHVRGLRARDDGEPQHILVPNPFAVQS